MMTLEHTVTIAAPVDPVWRALLDPQRVAPCFPGATLTSADGNEFAGTVKVRLGPISLQYNGSGRFTETDDQAHRAVIDASGSASGGQGTAAASVVATLSEGGGGTAVVVATQLTITGKPAQFGRGMLEDVGKQMIGQFADNLAAKLGA
ncbi:MAG TPA: SRPBCC family protein [Pseudonocardiaceae bacterium]|jgi:carbon monoxide dehydrogenase subunit G